MKSLAMITFLALSSTACAQNHTSHSQHPAGNASLPTESGQAAFATVQEIVNMLIADPATNWSTVNLDALRDHLIDMDQVIMGARVSKRDIPGGVEIVASGDGLVLASIKRMLPAHSGSLSRIDGWKSSAAVHSDSVTLTVNSGSYRESDIIRGLGFAGLMAYGAHHQAHHLAIAKGDMPH